MSLTKVTYSMIKGASLNVLDFGATGDGVTDDTAAIQAAITSLSTYGGTVFFPAGSYLISSTLNILSDGVSLVGVNGTDIWDGSTPNYYSGGSKIIKSALMTTEAIKSIVGGGTSINNLSVSGIAGNTGDGIYFGSGLSCSINNVSVSKVGGVGIRLGAKSGLTGNVNGWQLNNVVCSKNGSHGVYIYDQSASGGPNANAGTATGLNVYGNAGDGLVIENGIYNTFNGLLSQQNTGYGVSIVGAVGLSLYNVFNGGDVEANTAGQWNIGGNALHLTFIGGSTFVPSTVNPNNFQVSLSDGTSTMRSLKFSASGSTIDTYIHHGTFTPTILGLSTPGSNTYVWQTGYYSQIGKQVTFYGLVRLSAKDAAIAGNIAIGGLPEQSWSNTLNRAQCQINAENTTLGAGYGNFYGLIYETTNYIQLFKNNTTAGANTAVTASDISSTSIIYFSGSYQLG